MLIPIRACVIFALLMLALNTYAQDTRSVDFLLSIDEPRAFQISELTRRVDTSYTLLVECRMCRPSKVELNEIFNADKNNSGVDVLLFLGAPSISGARMILLDDD